MKFTALLTKLLVLFLWALWSHNALGLSSETSLNEATELPNASKVLKRLLRRYDEFTRPYVSKKTLQVNISMAVQAFSQIKESNMEFEVFMYLRQQWNDPRLAHGYRAPLSLSKDRVNQIWLPDCYFNNANEYNVFSINQLVLIEGNGDVYYSGRVKVKGACLMNLVNFPLDTQRCSLIVESFEYTVTQMNFKWKEVNPVLIFNKDLAEFDIVKSELKEKNVTYVAGVYKNLIVTFTFQRRMGFYFIQFYIPCIVMVTLSWISFWMDRYYIGERVSLGITTVLTIVFLLGSSNTTMPRVSYAKAIDWYLIGSFMFVFSTLVTDLLVFRFSRKTSIRHDGKQKTQITFTCKHGFKPTYVAEPNGEVHVVSYEEERTGYKIKETLLSCCIPITCTNDASNKKIDLSIAMNKCCRVMYPTAFALFNAIYWANLFLSNQ